ncbi:MAG: hypothetical protein NC127_04200 [Muribaculum sp.]|nr:hypothetical protein [Muribaculum sp.]
MDRNRYYKMRGLMSVVVGIIASLLLFIGLYFILFGKYSMSNPLSEVLLLLFIFMIGPAVMMIKVSPFSDDKLTLRYMVFNIVEALMVGFAGFQMLTGFIPKSNMLTVIAIVLVLYNVSFLIFQIGAFRKLNLK